MCIPGTHRVEHVVIDKPVRVVGSNVIPPLVVLFDGAPADDVASKVTIIEQRENVSIDRRVDAVMKAEISSRVLSGLNVHSNSSDDQVRLMGPIFNRSPISSKKFCNRSFAENCSGIHVNLI